MMIEDVTTKGGSVIKAIEAVQRETQFAVLGVLTVVGREQGARAVLAELGLKLDALFTMSEFARGIRTGSELWSPVIQTETWTRLTIREKQCSLCQLSTRGSGRSVGLCRLADGTTMQRIVVVARSRTPP